MIPRRTLLAAAACIGPGRLLAQGSFPERAVRLVVPAPPGGPSDLVARLLADTMRSHLGQPLVVENRPGAAGLIGTAAVAAAPADGYTVLLTSRSSHVLAPLVQKGTQVDPQRDLVPVGLVLRSVGMLATHARAPLRSLAEFIAQAKAQPGKLFYGSAGVGAANHVAVEQFKSLAGIDITHVAYKGSGSLVTGLIAGEVQLALLDFSSAQAGLQSGAIVPLVQTGARRLPSLPTVPTLIEANFRNFDPSFWIGLAAPRGTPPEAITRLNRALNEAVSQVQMRARAQINGWELVGGTPQVLADTIAADMAQYPALVRRLDIQPG